MNKKFSPTFPFSPNKSHFKVQLFWVGHLNVPKRPYGLKIYLRNVKTMRTIAQIFVAFSEKLILMQAYTYIYLGTSIANPLSYKE